MIYTETQNKILNTTVMLIQKQGFHAFSYKDISNIVGIKTSSIHYHFKTKDDLVIAAIDWHLEKLTASVTSLISNQQVTLQEKLHKFVSIILQTTYKDELKMCLGGMLAIDTYTMSQELTGKIQQFFIELETCIRKIVATSSNKVNNQFSKQLLSQIEGALILGRLFKDESYLESINLFIKQQIN